MGIGLDASRPPAVSSQAMNALLSSNLSDEPAAHIIDVVIPRRRNWRLLAVVLSFVVALLVLGGTGVLPNLTQVQYMAIGLLFGAGLILFAVVWGRVDRRHFRSALAQRLGNAGQLDPKDVVETVTSWCKTPSSQLNRLSVVLSLLAKRGHTNTTMRCVWPERRAAIDPIVEPFEPMPLDEGDAAFTALERGSASADRAHPQRTETSDETIAARRRWHRRVTLGGGWLAVGVFALLAVAHGIHSLAVGAITRDFLIWSVALVTMLFGFGGRGAWRTSQQWFLVPGGLVRRRTKRLRQEWDVHLFRRADGPLLVWDQARRMTSIVVADKRADGHTLVTATEADLALRAWLSPIDPPDEEHLSDLA